MSETSDSSRSARSSQSAARLSPMATIESSVTRLLVSTKHLLESLTQWARQEADDKFVSDAYVKLGNDFRAAARSFTNAGVDISDLGDVPRALRIVLESALSEAPTQANLDKFLPNIRSIIVTLLSNLKSKQARAKELNAELTSSPKNGSSQIHQHTPQTTRRSAEYGHSSATHTPSSSTRLTGESSAENNRVSDRPRRSKLLTELSVKAGAETPGNFASRSPQRPEEKRDASASASSDALAKLQKGNVISRRASKRFSAYQFAKLAGLNNTHVPRLSAELSAEAAAALHSQSHDGEHLGFSAESPAKSDLENEHLDVPGHGHITESTASGSGNTGGDQRPYIFLRIADKTKKAHVQLPVTLASLRLLFVEKFAYSPKSDAFPEIYVLDPLSNVSFELEELCVDDEVKVGTLLLLKAPSHHEESLKDLELSVHGLNSRMDSLASEVVSQVREVIESAPISAQIPVPQQQEQQLQQEASTNMESVAINESTKKLEARNIMLTTALKKLQQELKEVSRISASRETQVKELTSAMSNEIVSLKQACLDENSPSKNRSFMEESYTKLSEDSDTLLTRVDDLQDMMEALRKDVAQRGVRLGIKQLKCTEKEISDAKQQLSGLIEYIRDGKPTWKKIWESELDKVCEEQQFFNLQDDLTRDLDEDIRKIEETFDLIEKCSVHQSKQTQRKNNVFASRMMLTEPGESVHDIRDAVLSEVCALKPDHESRLDAIAKAEKIRERERQLESLNQFQEELGEFVDEKKFKSSGGIEELEKKRQQQDAENLKSSFGIV